MDVGCVGALNIGNSNRLKQQQEQPNQGQGVHQLNQTQTQQHRRQQQQAKPNRYSAAITIKVEDSCRHSALAPVTLLPEKVGASATAGLGVSAGTSESSLEEGARVQQHSICTAAAAAPLGPAALALVKQELGMLPSQQQHKYWQLADQPYDAAELSQLGGALLATLHC